MKTLGFQIVILCLFLLLPHNSNAQRAALKKADRYISQEKLSDAEEMYLGILKKDKDNLSATKGLAEIYKRLGETTKSEHWYSRALQLKPNDSELLLSLALACMQNKHYSTALRHLEQIHHQDPFHPQVAVFIESCEQLAADQAPKSNYELVKLTTNTVEAELSPGFYQDGLVFISGSSDKSASKQGQRRAYFAKSRSDLQLYEPKKFFDKAMRLEPTSSFCPAGDGNRVYFSSLVVNKKKRSVEKVFMMERDARGDWSRAKEFNFNSNDESFSVKDPFISADGLRLYFSSNMPGGYGGYDLYVTQWLEHSWSAPINLGPTINSLGDEVKPFEHADGELYFSSDGMGGFGGLDIFRAVKLNQQWAVLNIGAPVNDSSDDFGLVLSADKSFGFLNSNRKGGAGDHDIYLVKELLKKNKQLANRDLRTGVSSYDKEEISDRGYDSDNLQVDQQSGTVKVSTSGSGISHPNIGPQSSLDIMLVVLVVDQITDEPLHYSVVELRDLVSNEIQHQGTSGDGRVYFRLEPERQYTISKILENNIEDSELISTINRSESEIINLTLKGKNVPYMHDAGYIRYVVSVENGTRYQDDNPQVGHTEDMDTMRRVTQNMGRALLPSDEVYRPKPSLKNEDEFELRIQIGVFSRKLPETSNFIRQVRNVYEVEVSDDGLYHYFVGNFTHLESAQQYQSDLVDWGYSKASIVPYLNGERLGLRAEAAYDRFGEK